MATYIYETIPAKRGQRPAQYEIRQSMKDAPLTHHPETGEPVRRVITGGFGLMSKGGAKGGTKAAPSHTHTHSCGCGAGGCG